jgi:hypothetical protein
MKWEGHVARMGREELLMGKPDGDLGIDGKIILR